MTLLAALLVGLALVLAGMLAALGIVLLGFICGMFYFWRQAGKARRQRAQTPPAQPKQPPMARGTGAVN